MQNVQEETHSFPHTPVATLDAKARVGLSIFPKKTNVSADVSLRPINRTRLPS